MIPHNISDRSISVLVDNRMRTVPASSINFIPLRDELRKKAPDIRRIKGLVDIPTFIARVTVGRIRISDDEVYYKDEKVGGAAADRLLKHLEAGDSIEPLARLLEKLMENPNHNLRNDLWLWIEEGNLPIAEDGDVIAFKKVGPSYLSMHADTDGKYYDHTIGAKVSMERSRCDENRNSECSTGLHFCSYGYLNGYAGTSGHIVIVKINPRDIVAIPKDHNNQKGRTCLYEVIGEVPDEDAKEFLTGNVVSKVGTYYEEPSEAPDMGAYDNDYADEEEYYEGGDDDGPDYEADEGDDWDNTAGDDEMEDSDGFTVLISGKRFNIATVKDTVASLGQRGAAKQFGVARTSLQDALKRIS